MLGLSGIWRHFAGRHYRKFIKQCAPLIRQIHRFEESYSSLTDGELRDKTGEFRKRFQGGESLDQLLPEAFGAVMAACRRLCEKTLLVCGQFQKWEMVPYDEQLMGGIALHSRKIAELATGEGKTLMATLPLYLNALTGKNCQLVTVNDYLARRDSEWMGNVYDLLGLSVGCIQNGMPPSVRKKAYACDITYGTASEFGFDYLRDNGLALSADEQVQREHFFCIVDEVDSILIDEARTPLIISGPMEEDRMGPFKELCPSVAKLADLQLQLCNRLVAEAKEVLDKKPNDELALSKLAQVRMGMPTHRQLLKLLESNIIERKLDRLEREMGSELRRDEKFRLKEELYFTIDERQNAADLTELGRQTLYPDDPDSFLLPDLSAVFAEIERDGELSAAEKDKIKQESAVELERVGQRIHCIGQLLRAHTLFERDQHYIVHNGQAVIVDANTGRAMPGRRWSDGLHQAIEAKERLEIQRENRTFATITIQNYFRMYEKLAGMTGTAETEAQEFRDIYGLAVVVIPTHRPCIRKDADDEIYKTRREKYAAVIRDIEAAHGRGQPVLVGTTSVEASQLIDKMLQHNNLPHTVLNAKFHEMEANIVARAGAIGAITIATNMAGRGTDIKLAEGAAELGGLLILGTERHEARRIDRQLRGRCARQGDPGSSKFYVSLEDDLMRLFANRGAIGAMLERTFKEGDVLTHPLLNRSIAHAQKKIEQQNYSIRKRLLQYDDVLNTQREVIYSLRNSILRDADSRPVIWEFVGDFIARFLADGCDAKNGHDPMASPFDPLRAIFPIKFTDEELAPMDNICRQKFLVQRVQEAYAVKEKVEDATSLRRLEKIILLRAIDAHWQQHLSAMDDLRHSVGLRAYAQKNPLYEYKTEAFAQFEELLRAIHRDIAFALFRSATSLDAFRHLFRQLQQPESDTKDGGTITIDWESLRGRVQEQTKPQKGTAKTSKIRTPTAGKSVRIRGQAGKKSSNPIKE
ncbi:MAG: preprotein translocase subunit SecA [Puniceicoccales bacterium]|jgi:preprotein translocase subunit SecA|nr:preprotein translocase subunit SecA [Puniceicoccales bacterium]